MHAPPFIGTVGLALSREKSIMDYNIKSGIRHERVFVNKTFTRMLLPGCFILWRDQGVFLK